MHRTIVSFLATSLLVTFGCTGDTEVVDDTQVASIALHGGSLDWIHGCTTHVSASVSLEVTASTEPVVEIDLSLVSFEGWWGASRDFYLAEKSKSALPLGLGETATLNFLFNEEGTLGECSSTELPPQVPLSVQVTIDGVLYDATAIGHIGCGRDEQPEGGC